MEEKNKNNRWILFAGIGCIVLVCLCGGLIAGFFLIQRTSSGTSFTTEMRNVFSDEFMPLIGTPDPPSIEVPTLEAIQIPSLPPLEEVFPTLELFENQPDLTGNQYLDDSRLVDDFSSDALGWPEYDDGTTILKYENQAYSFQVKQADYYDWVYVPVMFNPASIVFDVWGLPGEQHGTFGVFCQYQDPANYYYAEFDLETREVMIGIIENDEFVPLYEPNQDDYYWIPVDAFSPLPEEVNTIALDCQPETITLTVNEDLVRRVIIQKPFTSPGVMALFVYALDFAGPDGYKLYFDNVTIR